MDNCAGQNKNGHVLRLALLLVELKYFKWVEFVFYVRGHTKNMCDRMFNLLKKRYHTSQIFSMRTITEKLNELNNINFFPVTSDVFFDYNELLDRVYKKFKPGTVKKNHLFWVTDQAPTLMLSLPQFNDQYHGTMEYDFNNNAVNRDELLAEALNNKISSRAPGIKPIKQVELWKK
jgi:hypothetical protein